MDYYLCVIVGIFIQYMHPAHESKVGNIPKTYRKFCQKSHCRKIFTFIAEFVCHLRPSVFLPTHLNTYFAFLLCQKVIFCSCGKNIETDFITIEQFSIVTLEAILQLRDSFIKCVFNNG